MKKRPAVIKSTCGARTTGRRWKPVRRSTAPSPHSAPMKSCSSSSRSRWTSTRKCASGRTSASECENLFSEEEVSVYVLSSERWGCSVFCRFWVGYQYVITNQNHSLEGRWEVAYKGWYSAQIILRNTVNKQNKLKNIGFPCNERAPELLNGTFAKIKYWLLDCYISSLMSSYHNLV